MKQNRENRSTAAATTNPKEKISDKAEEEYLVKQVDIRIVGQIQ